MSMPSLTQSRHVAWQSVLLLLIAICVPAGAQDAPVNPPAVADEPAVADPAPPPAALQAAPVPANQEEQYTQIYVQQFDRFLKQETSRMRKALGLTDEQVASLHKAAEPVIKGVAKEMAKKLDKNQPVFSGTNFLPEKVMDALLEEVGKVATADKLAAYRDDLQHRQAFLKSAGLSGLLMSLDDQLALLPTQHERLRPLLEKNWNEAWASNVMQGPFGNGRLPAELLKLDLDGVLRESQLGTLKERSKPINRNTFAFVIGGPTDTDAEKKANEKFKADLAAAIDLRIESLDALCELSGAQQKKLRVLAKGISSQLVRDRAAATKRMREALTGNRGAIMMDPNDAQFAQSDASSLLSTRTKWTQYANRVLTAEQRQTFKQMQDARQDLRRKAFTSMMSIGMSMEMGLSGKQIAALSRLMEKAFADDDFIGIFSFDMFLKIREIPKEDYIAAIGESNWNMLNTQLTMAAQQLENMKKARDKQEADDADAAPLTEP